jgi:N-acyl-D-aspartate/D-glutamate deacylase
VTSTKFGTAPLDSTTYIFLPIFEIMVDFDLVILNGVVVTAEDVGELDIGIKGGKIAKVVPRGELGNVSSTKTIDAKGGYIMVII